MSFHLSHFISTHITERPESLLSADIQTNATALAEKINGRSALVIGGAGTIGSSFIRALLHFKPSRLYVVDTNENGLTELTRDLRSSIGLHIPEDYKTYPINFGSPVFEKLFKNEVPFDIVANFAAHKHVRSEKDVYSIEAMIENNVLKTKHLLDLLQSSPPRHFFCVSTDKAANPVNIMGGSKKIMEDIVMAYKEDFPVATARFANVAFSNGSLLQGFMERLQKRQPLSAPSDVLRYFVSPEESGQICLLACLLAESGDIFFPKLSAKQMKTFAAIAENYLKTHNLSPRHCQSEEEARILAKQRRDDDDWYPVYFFNSDTSGEKSFEEFFTANETLDLEQFEQLGIIKNTPKPDKTYIGQLTADLTALFAKPQLSKADIVDLMKTMIPNFEHLETGKNLDQKM